MDLLWRAIRTRHRALQADSVGTAVEPVPGQIECGWVVRRESVAAVDPVLRAEHCCEVGARPRGAAALDHPILVEDGRLQRVWIESRRLVGNADARERLRGGPVPSRPVPEQLAEFMRRGSQRRVVILNRAPVGRLRGGASSRCVRAPRIELRMIGDPMPMMPVLVVRSGRVRRGGRRARCRAPRGDGGSEGRRGGGCRDRCLGDAREGERRRGNQRRDEPLSSHEGSGSSAPG